MSFIISLIAGIFEIVTSSAVSKVAQIICNASFFAPCGVISPLQAVAAFNTE
jgi:hypothetical protein